MGKIVGIVAEMARELNEPFQLMLDASYHDGMVDSIVSLLCYKFPGIVVDRGDSEIQSIIMGCKWQTYWQVEHGLLQNLLIFEE